MSTSTFEKRIKARTGIDIELCDIPKGVPADLINSHILLNEGDVYVTFVGDLRAWEEGQPLRASDLRVVRL
jgi:hypothetical protein